MTITLYKTNSPRNAVNKVLNDPVTRDITPKGSYSIENPVFTLHRGENEYFVGYNYAYIDELKSFYWVELSINAGVLVVTCAIDALMTHRDEISGLTCYIERQEYIFNPYINDPLTPIAQGSIIDVLNVGDVGGTRTMYLTCIGGVETPTT